VHCNGACKKYKAENTGLEGGRYGQGQKRCPQCEVFIEWEGLWCPCCGRLLRTKPRARKLKQKLALSRTM
jgi:hypothetical protein